MKTLPAALSAAVLSASAAFAYDTPEATVAAVRDAVAAGRVPSLSQLLPSSYQADLTGLAREFAGRMDPDLWNAGRLLVKSVGETFAPKAALLADLAAESGDEPLDPADKARLAASFGSFLQGLSSFATSDATTLDALKSGSFASLETAIVSLVPAGSLDSALSLAPVDADSSSELLKDLVVNGRSALPNGDVALTMGDGETLTLRKVDNSWVPTELADRWSEFVGQARSAISSIDFSSVEGQQAKMQALMFLPALQGMVQQLGTATTADELKNKATMMFGGLLGSMGGGFPGL